MSLNSNALISIETYVKAARIPSPASDEVKLAAAEFAINGASEYIETECNRTFISGSIETETFMGQGYRPIYDYTHKSIILKQVPITTLPSAPVLYKDNNGTWDVVDSTTYTYNATTGELYFHSTNVYYFIEDIRYKVEYYAGYENKAAIPSDIQMATVAMARLIQKSIDYVGVTGDSEDGISFDFKIPPIVNSTIKKYTR